MMDDKTTDDLIAFFESKLYGKKFEVYIEGYLVIGYTNDENKLHGVLRAYDNMGEIVALTYYENGDEIIQD